VVSRQIRKFFTGNLQAPVSSDNSKIYLVLVMMHSSQTKVLSTSYLLQPWTSDYYEWFFTVADPELELRREPGFVLLVPQAFLPSVISSFFYPK